MKRFLILIVLVLAGCGNREPEQAATSKVSIGEIVEQVNSSGMLTDQQADNLSRLYDRQFQRNPFSQPLTVRGLTSITDRQADILSKVEKLLSYHYQKQLNISLFQYHLTMNVLDLCLDNLIQLKLSEHL